MTNNVRQNLDKILKELYRRNLLSIRGSTSAPDIFISFYPYVGINHTIRVRDGIIYVRISDLFTEAPVEIHDALSRILLSKLFKKRVPPDARNTYAEFINNEDFRKRARVQRRKRGKKRLTSPKGNVYDLNQMFEKLNLIYFAGKLEMPVLSWSEQKTFRRLGNYDLTHDAVTLSRSLDSREVPKFVVEFVLYHEMLHKFHGAVEKNGRLYFHTSAFKRDEKRFSFYDEAEEWIEQNAYKFERGKKFNWRNLFY
ncbi:MAG: hypothetical protein ACK5NT_01640 [Pyrinomonadaceae bacterium]